jgi:hypothetical protein
VTPPAWKLVPVEPTEDMLSAGAAMCDDANDAEDRQRALGVWTMMVPRLLIALRCGRAGARDGMAAVR